MFKETTIPVAAGYIQTNSTFISSTSCFIAQKIDDYCIFFISEPERLAACKCVCVEMKHATQHSDKPILPFYTQGDTKPHKYSV